MRIILDTNVFVSGVFWSGPPNKILEAWVSRKISLVLSLEILEEYQTNRPGSSSKISNCGLRTSSYAS
jgi:putative PIN family toxin of toxin-antitoxin system